MRLDVQSLSLVMQGRLQASSAEKVQRLIRIRNAPIPYMWSL